MNSGIFVILLNWNGWKDTVECLESLFLSEGVEFLAVVCDNGSEDDSLYQLRSWAARRFTSDEWITMTRAEAEGSAVLNSGLRFVLIENSANLGFAGGNNVGIRLAMRHADCRYVWLLNNDAVVDPRALQCLVSKAESDERVGICGSLLYYYDNRDIVQAVGGVSFNFYLARGGQIGHGLKRGSQEIISLGKTAPTYIAGASMLVKMNVFRSIGLMEEGYFLYYEEIDIAERVKKDWTMAISTDSIVYHKEGRSIGTSSLSRRSALSQYYLNRNLIRFYALRRPLFLPIAITRVCREAVGCLLRADCRLFSATCRALFHAMTFRFGYRHS